MKLKRPPRRSLQPNYIPDALAHFDALPDSAYVRLPVVEALFAISGATVWRQVKSGKIPQPRKLTPRTTAWSVRELRRALSAA
ncbi:MAG: helix-turn-helix transcriptional regulator [Burkholderiales bacterium]